MARGRRLALVGLVLTAALGAINSSWLCGAPGRRPLLLAHRGLAQTFPIAGLSGDADTSKMIYPPEHPFIENTLASMEAAFAAGADVVELDVQRTADGRFAVFHDATLEFRSDGRGPVRAHTLESLQRLDVGFGYSPDGGKTFPFRGKGVGLMPSFDEVLARFPEREFLIDMKTGDAEDGAALAALLAPLPRAQVERLGAYGSKGAMAALSAALPSFRVMSRSSLMRAALTYVALGWTGYVPAACRDTEFRIPLRFAPLLWGWPHRFVARMDSVNTRVMLVAGDGTWSEGFDTPESLQAIPEGYAGVIWTNRIDRIGPVIAPHSQAMSQPERQP
ncbi:MAG TPA: glycerophosphodiester phosphodiesterase family protein [Polyangiaceae bacterium]|nr:glycerophosphodiester phosphodiesterase family protein [Polyangiaceae bacterium]